MCVGAGELAAAQLLEQSIRDVPRLVFWPDQEKSDVRVDRRERTFTFEGFS